MKNKIIRIALLLLVAVGSVSCDQLTKKVAREELVYMRRVPVVNEVVSFIWVENTGAFLSLGHNWPVALKLTVLILIPLASMLAVIFYIFKRRTISALTVLAFGAIMGGGIGNLYDRIVYGSVTDFLHLDFYWFETGVFNMADVSIVTGALLILFELYRREIRSRSQQPPEKGTRPGF